MIAFKFSPPRREQEKLRDPIDILLGVVADVRIVVDDRELVAIEALPIVELAAQLDFWLRRQPNEDFSYESAEADKPLLWFRRMDGQWQVGSDWEGAVAPLLANDADLHTAAAGYINDVRREVQKQLGVDVGPALLMRR